MLSLGAFDSHYYDITDKNQRSHQSEVSAKSCGDRDVDVVVGGGAEGSHQPEFFFKAAAANSSLGEAEGKQAALRQSVFPGIARLNS